MKLPLTIAWPAGLLLALCSNCTQEQRVSERKTTPLYPYTLGPVTMLVPATWHQQDYEPASEWAEEPYVFTNPAQRQDSLLGDGLLVTVKKRKSKPNLKLLQKSFVESMAVEGQVQVQMLSFQDSVFAHQELVLIDYDTRVPSQGLAQANTFACYYKAGTLITIIGFARKKSSAEDAQQRALFREVIYSVKWVGK